MKLHTDSKLDVHRVTRYGEGFVVINEEAFTDAVVVMPHRIVRDWKFCTVEALDVAAMRALTELGVEIVLLGTGGQQRFPDPILCAVVTSHQVGLEVMDTAAACRTYNLLANEGRLVAAALILGGGS